MVDHPLPALLARWGALIGLAVPAHRFAAFETDQAGVSFDQLEAQDQLIQLFKARFPEGEVRLIQADSIVPADFPMLAVNPEGQFHLVLARNSSGRYVVDGQDQPSELADCQFFVLSTGQASAVEKRSAHQWFKFALMQHRGAFAEGIVATLVATTLGLVTALYTMQVYDRVVPTQGYATLWVLTVGVAIAIVLELILKQVRASLVDRVSAAVDMQLSGVFFDQALGIRMDCRPRSTGTFASQVRQFDSVRNFLASSTFFLLADLPFALFFIGVIYLIAGPLALIPLVTITIAILVALTLQAPLERLAKASMVESNRKNGLLIDAIDGAEALKASGAEWKTADAYRGLTQTIVLSDLKVKALSTFGQNISQTIQQFNYVGLIAAGAYLITQGELSMGALIAVSIISGRAFGPLAQIPSIIVQWKHSKIALDALDDIMALPRDDDRQRPVVPQQCAGELELTDVNFAYAKDSQPLSIASLKIPAGQAVALVGGIGSGKSTLLRLLSGLYPPNEGRVLFDGVDMAQIAPAFLREHIGYLSQDVRLFAGTLRQNLTLGLPAMDDSQILAACADTGLDKVIQSHPRGLELELQEGGKGMSGGQRQLVGLTRMHLANPSLLLLDEPTAAMDAQLENQVIQQLTQRIRRNGTMIMATHKLGVLQYVDRVLVLDKGKLLLDGPRDAVLEQLRVKGAQAKS